MDITKLLSKLRTLDKTSKLMFSQKENSLLQFNRKNVLSSGTDSSNSDFDRDEYDIKGIIQAKEAKEREIYRRKLKSLLKQFEGNYLSNTERMLIESIKTRSH